VLDDLTQVAQGSETRTFNYDSLKRLSSATNPESGTVSYTYDANANLLTKKDARNITTTYSYDALNRKLAASYSDGVTPSSTFAYDGAGAYSIGRLTSESNANSAINYTAYDALGRVTASNQQTGGWTYAFSYGYNLPGSLTSETYPSGRTVTTCYDAANRPIRAVGSHGNSSNTYVTGVSYWPHGVVYKQEYPSSQVWRTYNYDNRLQVNGLWDALQDNPDYFLFIENSMNYGTTNNNGNILGLSLYVSAPGHPGVLTFNYDPLGG
jgi:YD repeat-containing protein